MVGFNLFKGKGAQKNGNKKKYKKVDMGDSMAFYYNEELGRYVERGKEDEAAQEQAPPPPPKRVSKTSGNKPATQLSKPGTGGVESRYAALPGFKTTAPTPGTKISPFASTMPNRNAKSPVTTFVPKILPVEDVSDNTDNSTNTAPATDDEKKDDGGCSVAESPVADAPPLADTHEAAALDDSVNTASGHHAPAAVSAEEPALAAPEEQMQMGDPEAAAVSMHESDIAYSQDAFHAPQTAVGGSPQPAVFDAEDTAIGDSQEPLPENCVSAGVQSATLSEAPVPAPALEGPPEDGEVPSPWVAYDYFQWSSDVWERVSEHDTELYYYHYVQFTVLQQWTSEDWAQYSTEYPEQFEYVDYYCHEWQEKRGTPTLPLPRVGQPLASGEGPVTEEWLREMEANVGAGAQPNGVAEEPQEDAHAHDDVHALPAQDFTAPESEPAPAPVPAPLSVPESPPAEPALITPQLSPLALKSPTMDALEPEAQMSPQLDKQQLVRDPSLTARFAMHVSPEPDPDEVDVWPKAALCAAIEYYAADMRPESVAASDDDSKYRELANGVDGSDGTAGLSPPVTRGDCKDDDDGDEEDGYGDVGSIAAVASPSSCKRREHEASIPTGPLSTAAATADADAALQHLEASIDTSEAEKAQRASAAYAPSMNLSDGHSEAPSSMINNAPSEAIMEEGDIAGSTTGISELPNIPELADELDAPVLPPMHGEVPSTTRPEINISDLEGWGMRVPRGAHTASCAAEAASTEVASEKGSDTNEVGDAPCTSGVNNTGVSGVGHSSGAGRGVGSGSRHPPSNSTDLQSPSGTRTSVPDSVNRRVLRELGKMNAMLTAACNTEHMPLDIIDQFRAVQTASDAMVDAMRGNKKLATETEALPVEPSTANTPATPLRADTELVTPVRTPGIHSDMSTPDIHQIASSSGAMLQPSSTGPTGLTAPFGGAHANPLFSNTLHTAAEEDDAWKPESAGPASEMQGSIAAQNQLAAELATLQNVHQSTMAQLEQVHAEYATLKEELEVAQAAQASAEADAAAQAQAAASAAESAEQFQQKAAAASQELQAALAKIEALKIESRTAAQSAEESAAEIAALQAQVEEMQQDSYEGMCALGIETDRVEALVEALASAGIDPNPILQDVENKHLEAAIADEMGGEDDEAGVTGGSEGETTDVGTSGVQEQAQAPVQSAEQELTSLGESQEVQGDVHEDVQAPSAAQPQTQFPVQSAEVLPSLGATEHQPTELTGNAGDSAWAGESQPGNDGWGLDETPDMQSRDVSHAQQEEQPPHDAGSSHQTSFFGQADAGAQQEDVAWGQPEQVQLADQQHQSFDWDVQDQSQSDRASWAPEAQAQVPGEQNQGFDWGQQAQDHQDGASWGLDEQAQVPGDQQPAFSWGEQSQSLQGSSPQSQAAVQQADVAWGHQEEAQLAAEEQQQAFAWDQQGDQAQLADEQQQQQAFSWDQCDQAQNGQADVAWGQGEQAQLADEQQQQPGFTWDQCDQAHGQQTDVAWGQGEQAQLADEQQQQPGFAWDQCDQAQGQQGGFDWSQGEQPQEQKAQLAGDAYNQQGYDWAQASQAQSQQGAYSWPGAEQQAQEQQAPYSWPGAEQAQQQHGAWTQEQQAQLAGDAYQQGGYAWPQADQAQEQQGGFDWGQADQGNFSWPNGEQQQQLPADAYQQGQYAWPQGEQASAAAQQGHVPWGQGNEQAQHAWGADGQAQYDWGGQEQGQAGWGADGWGGDGWGGDGWGAEQQQQAGVPTAW